MILFERRRSRLTRLDTFVLVGKLESRPDPAGFDVIHHT